MITPSATSGPALPSSLAASTAPAPAGALVRVQGIERRYGQRVALQGITLEVGAGERLALLGPNGSGKSTLLRILATLQRPSAGSASVDGCDVVRQAAAVRRRLGTVFQSPSLDGKLTVRENLRFQGWLFGLSGAELARRIEELLARFSLADRARERVEKLSGGLKRRVELAKTLLHRPALLLLDEPSTGLDPAARLDFWNLLLELQQERGLTIIAATHLLDEADRCHRVALLHEGRLIALDTPEALKNGVGGAVITVESSDPQSLAARVAVLGLQARVVAGIVRVENGSGLKTAEQLQRAFPREILAIRVGQPTLEDVFLAMTGHTILSGGGEP